MFEAFPEFYEAPMTELVMQQPIWNPFGGVHAPDFNGDGILDLYHHNHFHQPPSIGWAHPGTRKMKVLSGWDGVLRNGTDGSYYAANNGNGFMELSGAAPPDTGFGFDSHSAAFLDFDCDGIKDFYLVTGGAKGMANAHWFDNLLFWGEIDDSSTLGYRFVGGLEAALEAGLSARRAGRGNERGRHQYWFDADGDGLLDLATLSVERNDDQVITGKFYRNLGGRKFEIVESEEYDDYEEFASMAVLTDINGDGFAKELIVPSECTWQSSNAICDTRPTGSLGVYQYDSSTNRLRRKAQPTNSSSKSVKAKSIATEDFDLDGKPDVAILSNQKIDFYLSAARQRRCKRLSADNAEARESCLLRMDEADSTVNLRPICGNEKPYAKGFRFADFNLNGKIDMLVVCGTPGRHRIYELASNATWQELKNIPTSSDMVDYGDLNSGHHGFGPDNWCDNYPTTEADTSDTSNHHCQRLFSKEVCDSLADPVQVGICSLYKYQPEKVEVAGNTVVDIDNDGFVDVILTYNPGSVVAVRNTLGDKGDTKKHKFLAVNLDKVGAAASIGAIVTLTASQMGPNSNETITQLRVVSTQSHETNMDGGNEDRIIFGLGKEGTPTKLEIQWPHCSSSTTILSGELTPFMNSMNSPFVVEPAEGPNCHRRCFNKRKSNTNKYGFDWLNKDGFGWLLYLCAIVLALALSILFLFFFFRATCMRCFFNDENFEVVPTSDDQSLT